MKRSMTIDYIEYWVILEICKAITEQIYSEIYAVHHDRGRCSSDVKGALIHVIEDKFEHIHYREDSK